MGAPRLAPRWGIPDWLPDVVLQIGPQMGLPHICSHMGVPQIATTDGGTNMGRPSSLLYRKHLTQVGETKISATDGCPRLAPRWEDNLGNPSSLLYRESGILHDKS